MRTKTTSDYSKFKVLKGNRPCNEVHIRNLVRSFETNPLPTTILVDKDMRVLDGQHRLAALERLGKPVNYVVADATIEDVKMVNQSQKQWTITDVINSHIATGNQNYIDLKKDMRDMKVSLTVALSVASQSNKAARDGRLKYVSTPKLRSMISNTDSLAQYIGNRQRLCVESIVKLTKHPEYDHERAVRNFTKFQGTDKLSPRVNVKAYLVMLEDIYNYDVRKSVNRIRLV